MTREEAVEVLTRLEISNFRSRSGKTYLTEALIMAINALQTEPCEDCISRQAALDTFGLSDKTRKYGGDHSGYDTIMLYEVQDALEALPSVQPAEVYSTDAFWKMIDEAVDKMEVE